MAEVKEGLAAAVSTLAPGAPNPPPAEQLGLELEAGFELLPASALALKPAALGEGRRGPGRPIGARNKRTTEWQEYILGRYTSPLVFLAETYSRPVAELAAELSEPDRQGDDGETIPGRRCSLAEAFEIQRKAAAELAPYIHQKTPIAVDTSSKFAGVLVVGNVTQEGPESEFLAGMGMVLRPQQDQGVSVEGEAQSHAAQSHEGAKP